MYFLDFYFSPPLSLTTFFGPQLPNFDPEHSNFKRKLSKREKKEKKKAEKEKKSLAKESAVAAEKSNKSGEKLAEKLYNEVPETSFTRSISNPEAVMKRKRQQKLEKKLQQLCKEGGAEAGKLSVVLLFETNNQSNSSLSFQQNLSRAKSVKREFISQAKLTNIIV